MSRPYIPSRALLPPRSDTEPGQQLALSEADQPVIESPKRRFVYQERGRDFIIRPEHEIIFSWVRAGSGNGMIEACAGGGKTGTLVEVLGMIEGQIFFGAFGRRARDDIKSRVEHARLLGYNIQITTMHGAGLGAWMARHPHTTVELDKVSRIIEMKFGKRYFGETFIRQMVSYGKQMLAGVNFRLNDLSRWNEIMEHFGADEFWPDEKPTEQGIMEAIAVFESSLDSCSTVIDHDDMLYAPLAGNCIFKKKDWVLGDEWQDANPSRQALLESMLSTRGRALLVGDRNQAIFGFCHPPGTEIMTPSGLKRIESININDPIIISDVQGNNSGWKNTSRVLETHRYFHTGNLITISTDVRSVEVTPHHRIPIRIDLNAKYYTYMMSRLGVYRVGHCQAYMDEAGEFMLASRLRSEHADKGWLLGSHNTKEEAIEAEKRLLLRVKGTTFSLMVDLEIINLPTDEREAHKILLEHGRMPDFPLYGSDHSHRVARNGAFVIEACNIMEGMRIAFYSETQRDTRKRGRGRQNFEWIPVSIRSRPYSGYVYGITVPSVPTRDTYQQWPLYFAGQGNILVHNTGASSDAMDVAKKSMNCHEMKLTTTWRCSEEVTKFAQQWVPALRSREGAPCGAVRPVVFAAGGPCPKCKGMTETISGIVLPLICSECGSTGKMKPIPWYHQDRVTRDDAILCRYNRPLIQTAYNLIREGIPCKVEGRDIGTRLVQLARQWKLALIEQLEPRLQKYLAVQVKRARHRGSLTREMEAVDRVATLRVFMEQCAERGETTIEALCQSINAVFEDNVKDTITLSTGHKFKGRERPRIFWLETEIRQKDLKQWEKDQEQNIKYVITTRARSDLILVPEDIHTREIR